MSNGRPGILEIFLTLNYAASYRALRKTAYGGHFYSDRKFSKREDARLRVTLSKMKSQGYLENNNGVWSVTAMGKIYLDKFFRKKRTLESAKKPKNLIITFDIPEGFRSKRHWLRQELIIRGFVMLQKSVWFGPGPLSKDFVRDLAEVKILQYLKIFKAQAEEIV